MRDVFVHLSSMFGEVSIAVIGLLVHNPFQQYLFKQHEKDSKKDYERVRPILLP